MSSLSHLISYAEYVGNQSCIARGVTAAELAAAKTHERDTLERIRGLSNEQRGLLAMQSTPLPIWVVHYRLAGPCEDQQGCDFVVICNDHRSYWIQFKSSNHGATDFAARRARQLAQRPIGIVVIGDCMPLRKLAVRILAAVDAMMVGR